MGLEGNHRYLERRNMGHSTWKAATAATTEQASIAELLATIKSGAAAFATDAVSSSVSEVATTAAQAITEQAFVQQ